MNSSSKQGSTANVLKEFLPLLDEMSALKEKYAGDDFGTKYGNLNLDATFAKLGVQELTVNKGDLRNAQTMAVMREEESTEVAKDMVLTVESTGLELEGNVIRPANVVISLGAPQEATEEEANKEETPEAAKEEEDLSYFMEEDEEEGETK